MAGDGVSLQTNITQLGNVAKAQSQQAGSAGAGHSQPLEKEEVKPLEKVRETEKAEQKQVDPEADRDRRRRRRRNRRRDLQQQDGDEQSASAEEMAPRPGLGGLVDTKA